MKKFLFLIFTFFFISLQCFALELNEKCTLIFYKDGEEIKVEKNYSDVEPYLSKILFDTYDVNLNVLMSDRSVEDMKNMGTHLEIILAEPKIFKSQEHHMSYFAYKTYIVKESGVYTLLPIQKLFLTLQDKPLVRGIGSIETNPKIVNIDQRRIRVISGDNMGYRSAPSFAYGVDNDYKGLLELFKEKSINKSLE